ncbi:MAG TPA: SH3 domain-containing protein [Enhygromyxa sp.]|nr:SH3 domain-containing protein [Enhygromyxa sp.]
MSQSLLRWSVAALLVACLLTPEQARADVVDDAYAAGNDAAIAGDWAGAIEHWQRALELLPGRSAQLDYDLGTAYAQLGELGRATYHLERALQPEARPSVEVAEAARRNLGIVRRRAEVQAEVNDARISREESWWDLTVDVLAGQGLAWVGVISGWLLVLALLGRRLVASRSGSTSASSGRGSDRGSDRIGGALALVFASVFVLAGGLHGLAIQAADDHPDAIALDAIVELREGPGTHLPVAVRVQGGSRVRVLDERSGWVRVRLPAGLEGWAPRESIARLDKPPMRSRVRADKPDAVADQP